MDSPSSTWSQRVLTGLAAATDELAIISVTPDGVQSWTNQDLLERSSGARKFLDAHGAARERYVPALVTTRPASVALLLAGAVSNRPIAPLGPKLTDRELLDCLRRLDGNILLAEPEWADKAARLAAETGRHLAIIEEFAPGEPLDPASANTAAADIAFMLHTSGTTGLPSQVVVRQRELARRAQVNGSLLQLHRGARLVIAGLFHHVGGLGNIAVALGNNATMVLVPSVSVTSWHSLEPVRPTHVITVPSIIEMLLSADALTMPSLSMIGYGGSPIHPDTMRRIAQLRPDVDFVNLFGQTEGSPLTVLGPHDHRVAISGKEELLQSVGRAAPGVELRIAEAGPDGVGEVWAKSSHSFSVDAEGWQHTGDLGYLRDGYLYLAGRKGDKIIRGGENVFPLEVEQILESHPQVAEAAVVGVPDQRLGEKIRAFVVPVDPANPPDTEQLRVHSRERLAGFKVPADWRFVRSLPRNPVGKLLRRKLIQSGDEQLDQDRGPAT
ncbi:fatty acid--CoA ligase family protein [Nocardia sp. CA2R105]|uniref:class I adenylate-forming enzyme family protein n=1 Tax=Nocardia coffeae TaxID=2873381 RepID=UPI001CA6F76B|nr:fatty acid--CoA ligase family protein [Nocardia coffeae]MBY8862942.1 fatty acid--CoA ligase family protein [Nocardia coffeae]